MATSQKIASRVYLRGFDHDPGATTAVVCSPDGGTTKRLLDLRDYAGFGVLACPTIVGGTGVTKVEIVAYIDGDSTGAGTAYVVKDSGTVAADAVNDQVWQECTAAEVAQLGTDEGVDLRYVAARLTNGTNTDEVKVVYVGFPPKYETADLTATVIT